MNQPNDKPSLHRRIANDHGFHPATDQYVRDQHQRIRELTEELGHELIEIMPGCRASSLALTALDEVRMWATMAVATELSPLEPKDNR